MADRARPRDALARGRPGRRVRARLARARARGAGVGAARRPAVRRAGRRRGALRAGARPPRSSSTRTGSRRSATATAPAASTSSNAASSAPRGPGSRTPAWHAEHLAPDDSRCSAARRGPGVSGRTQTSLLRGGGYEIASSRAYRPRRQHPRDRLEGLCPHVERAVVGRVRRPRALRRRRRPVWSSFADRRPAMSLYPRGPAVAAQARRRRGRRPADRRQRDRGAGVARATSTSPTRASPAGSRREPPANAITHPRARARSRDAYTAPADNLALGLRHLARSPAASCPPGSFVFVLSDFLEPPAHAVWRAAAGRGWDIVPVIVQDPRWEQSFPATSGLALPLAEPGSCALRPVRLTRREAAERREANERRLEALLGTFAELRLDPVLARRRGAGRGRSRRSCAGTSAAASA